VATFEWNVLNSRKRSVRSYTTKKSFDPKTDHHAYPVKKTRSDSRDQWQQQNELSSVYKTYPRNTIEESGLTGPTLFNILRDTAEKLDDLAEKSGRTGASNRNAVSIFGILNI